MFLKIIVALFLPLVPLYFLLVHSKPTQMIQQTSIKSQNLARAASKDSEFKTNPLTVENIFVEDHSWANNLPPERKTVLIATGDILLARSVNYKTVTSKNFIWPFEKSADVLKSADITFINLETPLVEKCPLTNEGMVFCGDPRNIEGLLFAGIDVINIANNHSGNYGLVGVNNIVTFASRTFGKRKLCSIF